MHACRYAKMEGPSSVGYLFFPCTVKVRILSRAEDTDGEGDTMERGLNHGIMQERTWQLCGVAQSVYARSGGVSAYQGRAATALGELMPQE